MNRTLAVLILSVLLPSIGLGLTIPLQPYLFSTLVPEDQAAAWYGWSLALFALMQIVALPVLGAISDRFGRRPVLLVSLAGTAVDFAILAFSPSIALILISRIVSGLTAATVLSASASIADITPAEGRARRFGYIGACYGVSLLIGPILGAIIGEQSLRAPFMIAAGLSALALVVAWTMLPETRTKDGTGERPAFDPRTLNPLRPLHWLLTAKTLLPLAILFFVINFGGQNSPTNWAYFTQERFGFTFLMVGVSMALFGLLHALTQSLLVGRIVARIGESRAIALGLIAEIAGSLVLVFATETWMLFATLPLFALGGVSNTAIKALMSRRADPEHQGRLQGGLDALASVGGVIGPLAYGGLYAATHLQWPGAIWLFSVLIYLVVAPLVWSVVRQGRS